MNKFLHGIGLAVIASLALGIQSAEGRDKKDQAKKGGGRAHASAKAHVAKASNQKSHARPASSHVKRPHVASSSSRKSAPHASNQRKHSGGPAVHARSRHDSSKDIADRGSRSRSGADRHDRVAASRAHQNNAARHDRAKHDGVKRDRITHDKVGHDARNQSRAALARQHTRAADHVSNSRRELARNHVDSTVIRRDSVRSRDYAHHSTRYRSGSVHHHGSWHGDPTWYPDRSWDWHHRHRYFWNGAWVIGAYPRFGYDPVGYSYDSQPLYPVNSTGVAVQGALADRGYYDGPIDGIVGRGTRAAIADYQYDQGLPVSGLIDAELLSSLGLL